MRAYNCKQMTEKHSDIGTFIREQREQAALSLRKLADQAGISNPYLSQIERGLRKPSAEILKSIATGLSISAETLYARAGLLSEPAETLVEAAIAADPDLTPDQREELLTRYREMRESGSESQERDELT